MWLIKHQSTYSRLHLSSVRCVTIMQKPAAGKKAFWPLYHWLFLHISTRLHQLQDSTFRLLPEPSLQNLAPHYQKRSKKNLSVLPPTAFCTDAPNMPVPACVTGADGGAEAGAAAGAWGGGVDFTSFSRGGICICCCCCCCVKLFTNSSCWVFKFWICCWKATCTGCTTVAYSVIKFAWEKEINEEQVNTVPNTWTSLLRTAWERRVTCKRNPAIRHGALWRFLNHYPKATACTTAQLSNAPEDEQHSLLREKQLLLPHFLCSVYPFQSYNFFSLLLTTPLLPLPSKSMTMAITNPNRLPGRIQQLHCWML